MPFTPSYINVFPEYEHPPTWTDGDPYREALRSAGLDDQLFAEFEAWGVEWMHLAASELGDIEDWSTVPEVQPWPARGRALVKKLRDQVPAEVTVRYFDHYYGEWTSI